MMKNEPDLAKGLIEHCQIHKTSKCFLLLSTNDLHQCLPFFFSLLFLLHTLLAHRKFSALPFFKHCFITSQNRVNLVNKEPVRSEVGQTAEANMMQLF